MTNGPAVGHLPAAAADRNTLASVLRVKQERSSRGTMYTVHTSEALQGAAACAVTTVPPKGSLLQGINDADPGPVYFSGGRAI